MEETTKYLKSFQIDYKVINLKQNEIYLIGFYIDDISGKFIKNNIFTIDINNEKCYITNDIHRYFVDYNEWLCNKISNNIKDILDE